MIELGLDAPLNVAELELACFVGYRRQVRALLNGYADEHGYDGREPFDIHVGGAAAELVVARLRREFWTAACQERPGHFLADVGEDVEVRWAKDPSRNLIVRPGDPDGRIYYLVRGPLNGLRVIGYRRAEEIKAGKRTRLGNGRPPCYLVPAVELIEAEEVVW